MSQLSQEIQDLIFEHYEYGDLDWLSETIGKTKGAIQEWTRKRGLRRKICVTRHGSLEPLISRTLIADYWLGMYLSDGYVSKRGHFMLSQSEKDKVQVYKLAEFLGTGVYIIPKEKLTGFDNRSDSYRVNISHKEVGIKIRQMFGVVHQKTYDDIFINFSINKEQALSLLIGFIDGDGWIGENQTGMAIFNKTGDRCINFLIQKSGFTHTEAHVIDWKQHITEIIYSKLYFPKTTVKFLKDFAFYNELPVNPRKWDRFVSANTLL